MKGSLRWRIALAVVVTLWGVIYMLPSVLGEGSALERYLPKDKIALGLDLKGGVHLTLGIDVNEAIKNQLDQQTESLRSDTREEEIRILQPQVTENQTIEFLLLKADQKADLETLLSDQYNDFTILTTEPQADGRIRYELEMKQAWRDEIIRLTMSQAEKTIRNRVDETGVVEPDIRRLEGHRIQVQLPGMYDTERAVELIRKVAHLKFMLVNEEADPQSPPPGSEVYYFKPEGGAEKGKAIVLFKQVQLTGEYIKNAYVSYNQYNEPHVSMEFNGQGARKFERVTGDNVQKRLAIVLDDSVYSAPVIQDRIAGGSAIITGSFSVDEATDLAAVLRAGALPAPVKVEQQESVGPSLGKQSIDLGIKSALIGGALVLVFMLVYYGFAGLVADLVLGLNIVLILAGLACFGATLTLPGIAGIILTIGMAVDANVLIFERIREEIKKGLTHRAAIDEGYARATLTILDANVTTIIAAVILYQFGTGPIRGFAVTLSLGILASMFTAIFVSRIFFDLWMKRGKDAKLSI